MKWLLSLLVLVGGCAWSGVDRHARSTAHDAYALDAIVITGPRAGQLSASRLWGRGSATAGRAVIARDDTELRDAFVSQLERVLPVEATAARHLRVTLTLQDTGYYEGLAAETTDVTLAADVLDDRGFVQRRITLREPASAPLQRSTSRRQRLEAAFDRLARRLAAEL